MTPSPRVDIDGFLDATLDRLLAERNPAGAWDGELSTSALSTATATVALRLAADAGVGGADHAARARRGIDWLIAHQNDDGGWGDTVDSPSNPSTTTLCWAALRQAAGPDGARAAAQRAASWLSARAGGVAPAQLARLIGGRYGEDRTFSAPILTLCTLAGCFGDRPDAWRHVAPIPFELAALPRRTFGLLGLPMVSYALPALIAVGQVRHRHRPSRNPLARCVRSLTRRRTLRILADIQPPSGGFLEATPLTSFVVMSLIGAGEPTHPAVERGLTFLHRAVRADGSWPIDSDLSTWVTTLAVGALDADDALSERLSPAEVAALRGWLLAQQYREVHPYTGAAPGGWAWTPRSGGVPDADDTPGALLALRALAGDEPRGDAEVLDAAAAGLTWLLDLQNRDGGMPTFCRGWSKLPFDRSSPDLTAHALRAWGAWRPALPRLGARLARATRVAAGFLLSSQRKDGSWVPLWFGNQQQADEQNPLYGTTRVLRAVPVLDAAPSVAPGWPEARERAIEWVLAAQRDDGGFGADAGVEPSIEETALALEALAALPADGREDRRAQEAVERGCAWLDEATDGGRAFAAAPIGLYFARLWYAERLYPLIFTASALGHAARQDAGDGARKNTGSDAREDAG